MLHNKKLILLVLMLCMLHTKDKARASNFVNRVVQSKQKINKLVSSLGNVRRSSGLSGSGLPRHLRTSLPQAELWHGNIIEHEDLVLEQEFKVSRFWYHEMTGTIEARTLMAEAQCSGYVLQDADVAIVDDGFAPDTSGNKVNAQVAKILRLKPGYRLEDTKDKPIDNGNHGIMSASLIAGLAPLGASSKARVALLISRENLFKSIKELPPHMLVNLAFGYLYGGIPEDIFAGLNIATAKERKHHEEAGLNYFFRHQSTIAVQAAGNHFPHAQKKLAKTFDQRAYDLFGHRVVTVGSSDPRGVVNVFSESRKNVAVLAPGDVQAVLAFNGEETTKLGGTSAAVALVTAALADVVAFLPDLSKNEAEQLLRKTAIKTSTNIVSDLNGEGMLNHYKLLRVAQRMVDNDYPRNRQLLFSEQLYDFSQEAEKLFAAVRKSRHDPNIYLHKLRTAFFLDPNHGGIRELLAEAYRAAGLEVQALFYDVPEQAFEHVDVHIKLINRANYATQEKILLEQIVGEITLWVKATGRTEEFALLHQDDFLIDNQTPQFFSERPSVQNNDSSHLKSMLAIAEDTGFRNFLLFPRLIEHAQNTNMIQLLRTYAQYNLPYLHEFFE